MQHQQGSNTVPVIEVHHQMAHAHLPCTPVVRVECALARCHSFLGTNKLSILLDPSRFQDTRNQLASSDHV
jgi:hypothetical protein